MVMPRGRADNRLDLLQGTLDMLILRAIRSGPQHGYGISQAIREGSHAVLQVETGSLYPALHRLEAQGLIAAEWQTSDKGKRAKYYRLTRDGRRQLATQQSKWQQLSLAMSRVLRLAE
jgi:PadR family transcriptional regulator